MEKKQDDNAGLAYWLSNSVTLLHLLQRNVKPASGSGTLKGRAAAAGRSMLGGLFGSRGGGAACGWGVPCVVAGAPGCCRHLPNVKTQITRCHIWECIHPACATCSCNHVVAAPLCSQPGEASIHGGGVGGFRLVEAKYPALLFKQQLDALVQKIFPMMRDNVRKTITPLLVGGSLCRALFYQWLAIAPAMEQQQQVCLAGCACCVSGSAAKMHARSVAYRPGCMGRDYVPCCAMLSC